MLPEPNPQTAPDQGARASGMDGEEESIPAPVTMTLKRSVSPDRRIDSLSVEFSTPVSGNYPEATADQAIGLLQMQEDIAGAFLRSPHGQNGQGDEAPRNGNGNGNGRSQQGGEVPAQIVAIGGMNTRFGWRLFLNVQVNGQQVKLFGNRQQLAQHLEDAGCGNLSGNIRSGVQIGQDCRAVTRPSDDGRYLNIEKLLPSRNGNGNNGGGNGRTGR